MANQGMSHYKDRVLIPCADRDGCVRKSAFAIYQWKFCRGSRIGDATAKTVGGGIGQDAEFEP